MMPTAAIRSPIRWTTTTVVASRSTPAPAIVTVAGAIDRETDGASRSITVRATSTDGSFQTRTFTIAVDDVDEFDVAAISDTDAAANAVNENAANGTVVGVTAFASDADATTNTHHLLAGPTTPVDASPLTPAPAW